MSARATPSAGRREPTFSEMIRSPHQLIALTFGMGLAPRAPGTVGTLGGFPLFLALQWAPWPLRAAIYAALVAIGSWAATRTGEDLGEHDHNAIVFDETIAMALVLEVIAVSAVGWIAAFALFRLFDIWKPWPVGWADRVGHGGFFVILDDLLAAVWAGAILFAAARFGLL